MLYLTSSNSVVAEAGGSVLVSDAIASLFERALLESDPALRLKVVDQVLSEDTLVSSWVMRAAEASLRRTINRGDQASQWLAANLEAVLAERLEVRAPVDFEGVGWRVPALVARFAEVDRKLKQFDETLRSEKLSALKELAYGASHEINNPLANIAARAQTLLEDESDGERRRKLTAIHRQAMRAHEMISDLMLFARPPKLNVSNFELCGVVEKTVDEFRDDAAECDIVLTLRLGSRPIQISADETQIRVALAALIRNSLEAVAAEGQVSIAVALATIAPGDDCVEITVSDDGPGISPDAHRHMFDPFFSGREAGRGLGFGLSKCWRIVREHGGNIIVASTIGPGAGITIRLPISSGRCVT